MDLDVPRTRAKLRSVILAIGNSLSAADSSIYVRSRKSQRLGPLHKRATQVTMENKRCEPHCHLTIEFHALKKEKDRSFKRSLTQNITKTYIQTHHLSGDLRRFAQR